MSQKTCMNNMKNNLGQITFDSETNFEFLQDAEDIVKFLEANASASISPSKRKTFGDYSLLGKLLVLLK